MKSARKDILELEKEEELARERLIDAIETNACEAKIDLLTKIYNICQQEYQEEIERLKNKSSTQIIHSELNKKPAQPQIFAKPLRTFSAEDIIKINEHYKTLPDDLKALLDAALDDSTITMEKIGNPVFIKGVGYVYDMITVEETILKGRDTAFLPGINNEKKFTRDDIIPCNSLITAMSYMLDIVNGQYTILKAVEDKYQIPQNSNSSLSPEMIKIIEIYYKNQIESKHRILFDAVCRDSLTNMIMQEPVLLPDGYVYDKSTALFLLQSSEQACCPNMSSVQFTKEDITICQFSVAVLKQLEINIRAMQTKLENNENINTNTERFRY